MIGELAKRAGISAKTVRYYEQLGLLGEAERTESGYRTYGSPDVERLRFIHGAKVLGLSLAEIKDVFTAWDAGRQPCGQVSTLLERKLAELDRKIERMVAFRDELREYKARVDASGPAAGVPCRHIAGVASGEWVPSQTLPEETAQVRCASEANTGPLRLVRPPPK